MASWGQAGTQSPHAVHRSGPKEELGTHPLPLGVVATQAGQGAPLQENGGPEARPVVKGEAFYVEDDPEVISLPLKVRDPDQEA